MESRRSWAGQFRRMCVCLVALSIAALAPAVAPAQAKAASPILEFVAPGAAFPIGFTAEGGEVIAALGGFDTVVHCSGSHGEGQITGPRSTLSSYDFTGCETQGGADGGRVCETEGANPEEIKSETVEADLVYIDQARHEVGMLLNPSGGVYMNFECGGEAVKALGPFVAPVGPINHLATSFTATLSRSGATQTIDEYENANGEKLKAIPMGERGANPPATTGVELGFAIHPSAALEVRAVTAAEIEAQEAQRRDDEAAAAARKRRDEEAATAAAVKKHQEEEAAEKQRREQERARAKTRAQRLSKALKQCRKAKSSDKRARCESRVKKKYGAHRAHAASFARPARG